MCKSTNKVNLYHKVMLPIYVCPSTNSLHVQMKLPKHVLVRTREINREFECLISMLHSIFCVWGHKINEILYGGMNGHGKNI